MKGKPSLAPSPVVGKGIIRIFVADSPSWALLTRLQANR